MVSYCCFRFLNLLWFLAGEYYEYFWGILLQDYSEIYGMMGGLV